ncbi:desulfoferrodoxin FeS4 iron-binding domain-containing protein [Candidatus Dojkabacteria bacterium]|nr:desulfoferrodoxin FeS4 iron-binding domain-containing protein [Candidatus Dojkabacteria bacterium]
MSEIETDGQNTEKALIGDIFSCSICGQEVTIIKEGFGKLTCCGKPMNIIKEEEFIDEDEENEEAEE